MGTMRVIIRDVVPGDYELAVRAVRFLQRQPEAKRDAIVTCDGTKDFYVRRNKTSISVRPCGYRQPHKPDLRTTDKP